MRIHQNLHNDNLKRHGRRVLATVKDDQLDAYPAGGQCKKNHQLAGYTHTCSSRDYRAGMRTCCCQFERRVMCCKYLSGRGGLFRCLESDDTVDTLYVFHHVHDVAHAIIARISCTARPTLPRVELNLMYSQAFLGTLFSLFTQRHTLWTLSTRAQHCELWCDAWEAAAIVVLLSAHRSRRFRWKSYFRLYWFRCWFCCAAFSVSSSAVAITTIPTITITVIYRA